MAPATQSKLPASLDVAHRHQLLRTFTAWCRNPVLAEDLTQETLLAAWTSGKRPATEPDLTRWLFGVARNIWLRHRREQGKRGNWHLDLPDDDTAFTLASQSLDLDADLEREDIVALIDAALARIPVESRSALLLRYVDDLPQKEVADRLGLNEKALEGKLHRGKRAMHRYLVTDGFAQATSLGIVTTGDDWQVTNIWCDACGLQKLHGRWLPDGGLRLDCPACGMRNGDRFCHTDVQAGIASGLRSFGSAYRRTNDQLHRWSKHGLPAMHWCLSCGGTIDIMQSETGFSCYPEFWFSCPHCDTTRYAWTAGATSCHPVFRQWSKDEKRIMLDLATSLVERDGRNALHLRWHSRTSSSVFEALRDRETLRYLLIAIDGKPILPNALAQ